MNEANGGDNVFIRLCICLCAHSKLVDQTVLLGGKVKPTDFKLDEHVSRDWPDVIS